MSGSVKSCQQIESLIIKQWEDYIKVPLRSNAGYAIRDEIEKKLFEIIRLPFTTYSTEFYDFLKRNNKIISKEFYRIDLKLFLLVESYLRDKTPDSIEQIESYLKSVREKDFDACGIEVLRRALADGEIVRNVYRRGDQDLIQLFKKYLPRPGVDLFERDGGSIPDCIAEEAHKAAVTINALTQVNGRETLERCTIAMQRRAKGFQKKRKEVLRVMKVERCDENEARLLIRSGNRPYMPQCKNRNVALRIFNAAFLVPNFPTMSHATAARSLPQILDGCLYGRQSLAARYSAFRPAQLYHADQENGDANAICCAPQEIDANVWKEETVEIILNMEKFRARRMERLNPCIFFKQQDLGYLYEKVRQVWISQNASIKFNHTTYLRCQKSRHTGFLLNPKYSPSYAEVPFQELISSNFESMTAIQALNFFKYLDSLTDAQNRKNPGPIDAIYAEIALLDDKQLVDFLARLHKESTDTAEFNFYGAYRIDPELIESIRYFPHSGRSPVNQTSVSLPQLIDRLNEGDLTLYRELQEKMPFLFESKRFVNFLHSKVKNKEALEEKE